MFTSRNTSPQRGGHRSVQSLIACLVVLFGLTVSTATAHAAGITWHVDQASGSDSGSCGIEPSSACATIGRALELSTPGDVIHIATGTYAEQLVVSHDIDLVAVGPDVTVQAPTGSVALAVTDDGTVASTAIDWTAPGDGSQPAIVVSGVLTLDACTVDGVAPSGSAQSDRPASAVLVAGGTMTANNCTFTGSGMSVINGIGNSTIELNGSTVTASMAATPAQPSVHAVSIGSPTGSLEPNTFTMTGGSIKGAALFNLGVYGGTADLTNVTIPGADTDSPQGRSEVGIRAADANVTITGGSINNHRGMAINVDGTGTPRTLALQGTELIGNGDASQGTAYSGAIIAQNSSPLTITVTDSTLGGNLNGIVVGNADVDVTGSTIVGSYAAVRSQGNVTITNSRLIGNEAMQGAPYGATGIDHGEGDLTVDHSLVTGFTMGIQGTGGSATIRTSTIADNKVVGVFAQGAVRVIQSTVANNGSDDHDAPLPIAGIGISASHVTLYGSVLSSYPGGVSCVSGETTLVDAGHNVVSDESCVLTNSTSLSNTDPELDELDVDSGVMVPQEASPVLDLIPVGTTAGDQELCAADSTDQRGVSRPFGDACDAGAAERNIAPVTITTESLPDATLGLGYSMTLEATGGDGDYAWSVESGNLPDGMTLWSSTGVISGDAEVAGTFTFTVRADTGTRELSITVVEPVVISPDTLPDGTVGEEYSQALTADGGTGDPWTWTLSDGDLPDGLELSTDGVIAGTPTAEGTFTFTVQVNNGPTKDYTITIGQAAQIITESLPTVTVGDPYDFTLEATGGDGDHLWSLEQGDLPDGVELSADGVLSGITETAGTFEFTVRADTATRTFTITVLEPIVITPDTLTEGYVAQSYEQGLAAEGGSGGPWAWTLLDGELPDGLELSTGGVISGIPTVAGEFTFTVQVAPGATREYTITIWPELLVTNNDLPDGTVGQPYEVTLEASGGNGGPYTWWVEEGDLPDGLSLSEDGVISGTPTVAGEFTFTIGVGDPAYQEFTVTIGDAPDPQPTGDPTDKPTGEPTADPTDDPTGDPTGEPTGDPSATESGQPGGGDDIADTGAPGGVVWFIGLGIAIVAAGALLLLRPWDRGSGRHQG